MLHAANRAAVRLWKDESGVVFALTIIVFLTLFMMGLSVYAVGETVRQRIELQNAADAAAYSAAIVQADCLSRVAALNRAMSWTYVQMVRDEMDYIVDKWLDRTEKDFLRDQKRMRALNAPSSCHRGVPYYNTGTGVRPYSRSNENQILLNGTKYDIAVVKTRKAIPEYSKPRTTFDKLVNPIKAYRATIKAMNAKEKELITSLPDRIKKTVQSILKANIQDTWNDSFLGGAQISYFLKQAEQDPHINFRILESKDEADFLRHSNYIPDNDGRRGTQPAKFAEDVFGPGSKEDQWFVRVPPGMQRHYQRGNKKMLIAEWDWYSSLWEVVDGECVGGIVARGKSSVMGDDPRIYLQEYYTTELAEPRILNREFFNKNGALVVGLTRRLNNPLQFLVAGGELGIIRPFTLDGGSRYMWTASAARAGYNPPKEGATKPELDCSGEYEETWITRTGDDLWNLKTSDWDAVLLPLHRAWTKGENRKWTGVSAGQILTEVKGGPWVPLYGGGGAPENEKAPKLMDGGGAVSYGSAEAWVVH